MKIALAQFNPTVGDFLGNAARILDLAGQAKQRGADLAVFTELCLCGYPTQDLLERPAFLDRNMDELKALAAKIPMPSLVGYAGRVKNSAGKSVATKRRCCAEGASFLSKARCCCRATMYSTSRVTFSLPISKWSTASWTKNLASRFARMCGTTRTSGRRACTSVTRWWNSASREPASC